MRKQALAAVLVVLAASSGCANQDAPAGLLNVVDFAPRQAEVGDRLEVLGTSLPEGKAATLAFRGDLHRPGQEPVRGVEIVAVASSTSQNRIALVLTETLQAELCGRGEDADHTTFRGEVVAAFASKSPGAPPVTGAVHDVVLDVNGPAVAPQIAKAREVEGRRALEHIGVELELAQTFGPATISAVVPGGRADRAGLLPGDVLLSVDDVSVRSVSDVVFSGERHQAKVELRRGRLKEPLTRWVDVQGFRPAAPRELATASVLIFLVVASLLFSMGPLARGVGWVERRVAARLRQRRRGGQSPSAARWLTAVQDSLADDLVPSGDPWVFRLLPYLVFLGASAGSTLIAFGRSLVSPDLDLGLVLVASITVLTVAALMSGGWYEPRRWSIARGFKSGVLVLALQLPVVAAFGSIVLTTGSTRLVEIVRAQGAAPWTWNLFKNPVSLLAFVLMVVTSVPELGKPTELGDADLDGGTTQGRGLAFYAAWAHLLVVSTLAALLFLGGFRVAGGSTLPLLVLGALVLQIKCWAVAGSVVVLRWALPRVRADQMLGVFFRFLLPASVVALAASLGWTAWLRSPVLRTAEPLFGALLFGLTTLGLLAFTHRVRRHVRAPSAPMHVNPWL